MVRVIISWQIWGSIRYLDQGGEPLLLSNIKIFKTQAVVNSQLSYYDADLSSLNFLINIKRMPLTTVKLFLSLPALSQSSTAYFLWCFAHFFTNSVSWVPHLWREFSMSCQHPAVLTCRINVMMMTISLSFLLWEVWCWHFLPPFS